jgi:hypothetical protein
VDAGSRGPRRPRQHLQTAGVIRAELFTSDAQRTHITFHDLRATGITWCAVRGDDPLRIKQRAGHNWKIGSTLPVNDTGAVRSDRGHPGEEHATKPPSAGLLEEIEEQPVIAARDVKAAR